ncbi:MAG: hypothetical protein L6V93_18370 [Clostridiales bacterium]|nr:MAG: hypothetical protein L6V93_18370 [Clostridiales bacterium]
MEIYMDNSATTLPYDEVCDTVFRRYEAVFTQIRRHCIISENTPRTKWKKARKFIAKK